MDSNEEKHIVLDEFQDPRGTPIMTERLGNQEEDDRHKNITSPTQTGKIRKNTNGACGVEDNLTANGDVLMWDLDDVGTGYTSNSSDHLTSRNPQPKGSEILLSPPATSNRVKQLTQVGILGTKPHPHRPINSPSDVLDTYRFRDLFPNPELKKEMTNRLGKINAGGAFIVDNNITMHGDVMMLDLESEGEGHSSHTYTAVEKFSQLTETPMSATKPTNVRATTTGIRHLMTLRNTDLVDLPSGSDINPEKKRKRKKRKHKHAKITKNDACVSETQDIKGPVSCVVPPSQKFVDEKHNTEKKPEGLTKILRYQMSRLRAYIQKKIICH